MPFEGIKILRKNPIKEAKNISDNIIQLIRDLIYNELEGLVQDSIEERRRIFGYKKVPPAKLDGVSCASSAGRVKSN